MTRPVTIDFETKGIARRPDYPPVPVGVSIKEWGKQPRYFGWGHPTGNNATKADAVRALKVHWKKSDLLFHNAKFDYDVAVTHLGMSPLPWRSINDTQFLLYLDNPHALELGLKPSAERLLGMKPDERDAVEDWLIQHQPVPGVTISRSKKSEHYAGRYICEAPGGIVGPYANGDVVRTEALFKKLYPSIVARNMLPAYDRERELMPILLDNEREGIRVDVRQLGRDIDTYEHAQDDVEAWLRKRLKTRDLNFDSDAEVADALEKTRVVTRFASTPTGKRSVSKKNLTPDMFRDPQVAAALGYRNRLVTCLGMFMRKWYDMSLGEGRIYTNWNQVRNAETRMGTRTGRLSSNPNFQNIPKDWYDKADGYLQPTCIDVPELPMIRRYILPDDKDSTLLHRDYNQQELRILAHFEDGRLLADYVANPHMDLHTYVQQQIVDFTGVHFERRAVKIINFGMMYGQGAGSLAEAIGCTVEEARSLRKAQQRVLPGAKELDKGLKALGKAGEPIRTLGGREYYCEKPLIIDGRTVTFEYKLLNYLIQGSAADCTKQALIDYHNDPTREGRFMITVHDEINVSAPKVTAKLEMKRLQYAMQSVPLDCPLLTDGKMGPNWAQLKKVKE